jgi:hypothetical protein
MLNQSEGLITNKNDPKVRLNISSIAGPRIKKNPYLNKSMSKKTNRARGKSTKSPASQ